jgi:hypothetical protein
MKIGHVSLSAESAGFLETNNCGNSGAVQLPNYGSGLSLGAHHYNVHDPCGTSPDPTNAAGQHMSIKLVKADMDWQSAAQPGNEASPNRPT